MLPENLYYNYYYPKPKYLVIEYMDPLGWEYNSVIVLTWSEYSALHHSDLAALRLMLIKTSIFEGFLLMIFGRLKS